LRGCYAAPCFFRKGLLMVWYILLTVVGAIIFLALFLLLCGLRVSKKRIYTSDSKFYRGLVNCITGIIIKLGRVKLHVTGREKLPVGKKILFVGNHLSNFDPMVTYYALRPWRISYIAKASIINMPLFGRYIRRCCFMVIDRENPRNAIVTINKAAELLKAQEVSIGVYPEGTRSAGGELLPFHNGVFKIAQKADADIAVVSLFATEMIAKNFPKRRTDVYIDIVDVIPADMLGKKTDMIGQRVEELLTKHSRKRE